MRPGKKSVAFGASALLVGAIIAIVAAWNWSPSLGGPSSNASLVWNVEYWHRNADGEVLQHKIDHNTITVEGLDATNLLLIDESAVLAAGNPLTDNDTYDQILLMDVNLATRSITSAPLSADILLLVDGGDDGNNTGQDTDAVHTNPADGLDAATGGGSGDGTVTSQFLAVGNPDPALQMRLVKAVPDDTNDGSCCAAITLAETLAVIAISVDLADTDTLTITWTIDVSP